MNTELTLEEARAIADHYLLALYKRDKYPCTIESIQEVDFGWVFGFTVRDENTGEVIRMLGGGCPFFIDRQSGMVIPTPSLMSTERHIVIYRKYRQKILSGELESFQAFRQGFHEIFDNDKS